MMNITMKSIILKDGLMHNTAFKPLIKLYRIMVSLIKRPKKEEFKIFKIVTRKLMKLSGAA